MKSYSGLWEKLITKDNFETAYKNSIKGKSRQRSIIEFQKDKDDNLERVRQMVISQTFHTSPYKEKVIYEPKERVIYKLPYNPDRIVQHAIMNVLKPILTNLFIENSFACVEGKGPHKASRKCAELTRKYNYCLKCDIRKFYPSINQSILHGMLARIIKDGRFMRILEDIIYSFPGGCNCPIGNYCSQWFGNFYLTKLDNYVLHGLKCKGYLRYCDDFILFSNDKEYLRKCKVQLNLFLKNQLQLSFSKADIFPLKQGVDFCGYRHFKKYILLRKSTAKRIKKRIRKIMQSQKIVNITRTRGQIASAMGQLKHCCSYNFKKAIDANGLERRLTWMEAMG